QFLQASAHLTCMIFGHLEMLFQKSANSWMIVRLLDVRLEGGKHALFHGVSIAQPRNELLLICHTIIPTLDMGIFVSGNTLSPASCLLNNQRKSASPGSFQ